MTVINLATLPEYYYLYALYFDYQLNNRTHLNEEEARRVEDILRRVHPLGRRGAPFRKSWALRLFTERDDLTRFSPHQLKEAWHQLHRLLEQWRLTRGWDRPTADRLGIVRRADTYPRRRKLPPSARIPSHPPPYPVSGFNPPPFRLRITG